MIVLPGARDGVKGGSVTLACMSGSPRSANNFPGPITVPAGPPRLLPP
jgi:hypothetical protein